MKQYLLSMYQPEGPIPPPEVLAKVMQQSRRHQRGDQGRRVVGLHRRAAPAEHGHRGPRRRTASVLTTDGPFAEGKEHLGGFWIINAEDLDAALGWARKITEVTTLPMEVRPFQDRTGG